LTRGRRAGILPCQKTDPDRNDSERMKSSGNEELFRKIPSISELLKHERVVEWLEFHPLGLVTESLRQATGQVRQQMRQAGEPLETGSGALTVQVLDLAQACLERSVQPRIREAINATGIILHTGLGRAVVPGCVVDSMLGELRGYCTLAVDPETGERAERDELIEYILTELTGAEAATVVNNNAAATMLVLAGLAAQREVVVSRGQLIEIGGSFRLPEVMAQSGAKLVEVGATNRTHLKDYAKAIGDNTAALMRVHPSNYRVVGFTSEVPLPDMVELAHSRSVLMVDDLGAGALLGLEQFGLPHEPTVRESIDAGADVVLFSGDKLIGAGQCGIIVGRKALVDKLRKHPLMRALRVDKTCAMMLERTLYLFRDVDRLRREHPTYRMICTPLDELRQRAEELSRQMDASVPRAQLSVEESIAYLGSGSLPDEAIRSYRVNVRIPGISASELAKRLRMDQACVFARIEGERVRLDVRTLTQEQVPLVAQALGRVAS
jgi:L-seryl-tRNA(Ser) seleniumtransferase